MDISEEIKAGQPRLVELIQIEEPWRLVCEWVLGEALYATTLDSFDALLPTLTTRVGESTIWVTSIKDEAETNRFPKLSDKISGFKPAGWYYLENIFAMDTLDSALTLLPDLTANQSIITADGVWLGTGWVRIADLKTLDENSVLIRQQTLKDLEASLQTETKKLTELEIERERRHGLRIGNEEAQQSAKLAWTSCQEALHQISLQLQQQSHNVEQIVLQQHRLQQEQEELTTQLETLAKDRLECEEKIRIANEQVLIVEQEWESERSLVAEEELKRSEAQAQVEEIRTVLFDAELQCNQAHLKIQQLSETIARAQLLQEKLLLRLEDLLERQRKLEMPNDTTQFDLIEALEKHLNLEQTMNHLRQHLEDLQQQLRALNQSKLTDERNTNQIQTELVQLQLTEQSLATRSDGLLESFSDLDLSLCITQCPADATIANCEAQLSEIANKLQRLGAINLLAIDEYQTELARKTHLDEQSQDLNEALGLLEMAILKNG